MNRANLEKYAKSKAVIDFRFYQGRWRSACDHFDYVQHAWDCPCGLTCMPSGVPNANLCAELQ